MNLKNAAYLALFIGLSVFLGCDHTYKRETMMESVRTIAKEKYDLDVTVADVGDTLGVRFRINNMLGELVAEDQLLWKQMEDLMMVLSRVVLSSDKPPQFIVLNIVDDENPKLKLVLTRHVVDLRKIMSEAMSRTAFLDRLLMEFVIGKKRILFDPYEMDLVRLMMLAVDVDRNEIETGSSYEPEPVYLPTFIAQVTCNTLKRQFREMKKINKFFQLRKIEADYKPSRSDQGRFKFFLDLVTRPSGHATASAVEKMILPHVIEEAKTVLQSYKFNQFSDIIVIEKNSGKLLTAAR